MAIQENIQGDLERMSASVQGESIPVPQVAQADAELVDQDLAAAAGLQTEEMPEFEPVAGFRTKAGEGLGTLVTKAAKKVLPKKAAEAVETVVEQTAPNFIKRVKKATAEAEERSILTDKTPEPTIKAGVMTVVPEDEIGMTNMIEAFGMQKGKGINLVRLMEGAAPETQDALQYMNAIKNANKELFEAARRGTMNMEQITDEAMRIANANGLDDVVEMFLERKPGEVFNSEEFLAGFLASVSVRKEVDVLTQKAYAAGASETDKMALRYAMNMEADLLASISGNVSEGGRLLYTVSQLSQTMGADFGAMGARSVQIKDILNTFGGEENFDIAVKMYASLTDPMAKVEFVRKGRVAKTIDALMEVYINSILSSPVTHMVNVTSNFIRLAADIPETAFAGVVGKVRSKLTGDTDRVYSSEAFASMSDFPSIMRDAFLVGGQAFVKGEPLSAANKIELRTRRAITSKNFNIPEESLGGRAVDLLGTYYRLPGRFLVTEDEVFKSVASQHLLRKQATRDSMRLRDELSESMKVEELMDPEKFQKQLRSLRRIDKASWQSINDAYKTAGATPDLAEKLKSKFIDVQAARRYSKVMKSPPQYMVDDIAEASKEMVFQNDLPDFLAKMEPFFNNPVVKLVVPFYKTPSNVILATLERSPVQALNPKFYQTIKAGGPDADMAISKFMLGSGAMSMMAWGSMGGFGDGVMITGAGPEDLAAQQNLQAMGIMPYTVNFKNDDGSWTGYSYNQLGPHAGLVAMAADLAYFSQHEDDPEVLENLAFAATVGVAQYMTDLPMVEGLSDISKAFGPEYRTWKDKISRFVQTLSEKVVSAGLNVAPTVSSASAAMERWIMPDGSSTLMPRTGLAGEDPTRLNPALRGFYEALQKAKARNPFFSKDVPPKLNRWAEVVPQGSGSGWDVVTPWRTFESKHSQVGKELERLQAGIKMPEKKKGGVIFNAEQYNFLLKTAMEIDIAGRMPGERSASGDGYDPGSTMYALMVSRMNSPEYAAMDKDQKKESLQGIASAFDRMALEKLKLKEPDLATRLMLED